jgi:hypothetical protein
MKYIVSVVFFVACAPQVALANCGDIPAAPSLLQMDQVNTVQLELLDDQLNGYLETIQAFQDCIDGQVVGLDPEAENYDTMFEDLMILMDSSEQQKLLAVEKFNMHVDTVETESESEPNNG